MAWNSRHVGRRPLRAVGQLPRHATSQVAERPVGRQRGRSLWRRTPADGVYRVRLKPGADEVVEASRGYDRAIVLYRISRFDASRLAARSAKPALEPVPTTRWSPNFPGVRSRSERARLVYLPPEMAPAQQRDFEESTGGFIHGFRYAVRALSRILDERHHERPWPHRQLESSPAALADAVVARANRSSALLGNSSVIGVLDRHGTSANRPRYHEEVPVAYAHESQLTASGDYFAWSHREYGPDHDKVDPLRHHRAPHLPSELGLRRLDAAYSIG
ncbi:hypothetical protein ACRAWF_30115 [Streptomyces sp. L7]